MKLENRSYSHYAPEREYKEYKKYHTYKDYIMPQEFNKVYYWNLKSSVMASKCIIYIERK